jgi:hypothetical protein
MVLKLLFYDIFTILLVNIYAYNWADEIHTIPVLCDFSLSYRITYT